MFTFDPMGPDNLNDLEQDSTYVLTTQQITEEEDEESKEEIRNLPVPESTLKMLADENISMKEDLELKLGQILEYKYIINEYSDKLEVEIERNRLLNISIEQIKQNKSMFGTSKASEMQDLVKDLTVQLTEKLEEIMALKTVNRQLCKKLDL